MLDEQYHRCFLGMVAANDLGQSSKFKSLLKHRSHSNAARVNEHCSYVASLNEYGNGTILVLVTPPTPTDSS